MKKEELIEIIDQIIASLKENPDQFVINQNISVSSVGMHISSNGGIGVLAQANGGGTGLHVSNSMSDPSIHVSTAKGKADEIIKDEISQAIKKIDEIKQELMQERPEKQKIRSLFEEFKLSKILSGVTSSVLGYLLTKHIGI